LFDEFLQKSCGVSGVKSKVVKGLTSRLKLPVCVGRYQSNVARDVLDTILSIQPKDSGGGGETRETVVYRLAEEFLSKLPRNYVDFEVNPLIAILKLQSNGPIYSNTMIGTLGFDGWAVTFGTARRGL